MAEPSYEIQERSRTMSTLQFHTIHGGDCEEVEVQDPSKSGYSMNINNFKV